MEFCAKSDKGQIRKINQDSFGYYTADAGTSFFIVPDGREAIMLEKWQAPWRSALSSMERKQPEIKKIPAQIAQFIEDTFRKANDIILYKAASEAGFLGMGTTAVAAVVAGGKLIIGNLGDSPGISDFRSFYPSDYGRPFLCRIAAAGRQYRSGRGKNPSAAQ